MGLYDNDLNIVVEYTYDSWGNVVSVTGSLADTLGQDNPFRYRGYYYDNDTELYYLNSRYYDSNTGRFINADGITDGGAGLVGTNLFIYVANNPVNASDSSGKGIIKDAIKWTAKNVVKPVVKGVQNVIGKLDFTFSQGIAISASPSAFSFTMQAGISIDTQGNVAVQGGFIGGMTTGSPGVSVSRYRTTTNAPSIRNLEGLGVAMGGSVGTNFYHVPLYLGGDVNIIPDEILDKRYFGITKSIGFGTHGVEGHIEWGETVTFNRTSFNVFDAAKGIYIKIMEW